jgi:hypothetical protein
MELDGVNLSECYQRLLHGFLAIDYLDIIPMKIILSDHQSGIVRLVMVTALLLPSTAGFAIHRLAPCRHRQNAYPNLNHVLVSQSWRAQKNPNKRGSLHEFQLYSGDDGNGTNDEGSNSQEELLSKRSVARAGGRKQKVNKPPSNNSRHDDGPLAFLRQWAVPLLLATVLLRFLFGGLFSSNSNYVYYSRSVYESTTYLRDGNVETKRKETFQSNVPGLVERSKDGSLSSFDRELVDLEDEVFDAFSIQRW